MPGYVENIEELALANTNFRKVVFTGQHVQLVLMRLGPNEEIGEEVHEVTDQFLRIEAGEGKVIIDGNEYNILGGSAAVVPAGSQHNVINVSESEQLKLYTIYSPAHHEDGIVRLTKEEAKANGPEFDGKTSE